ncbi:hypothetical protein SAMN05444344_0991 [Tenacibaculum mesophilum]|uniref:DUF3592 domain-containing protein n=1 Tax=Tenacibaculum mesophilum TaxID=104268 RepID=A0ABN5TA22_9FLAO|nr:hypothetical protein [Tenacibaculum mesophilum]AZJ33224.1 hypothetical protein D6200_11915 [Tenacibaculum mesophilum]QFS28470.1 hypothetical protein F9Y86_08740 [Tenacibaculum mesophilum]SHF64989.1 hypothetical protein SAMN05444344_0991 [Tenacibaculum mesophilum]
MKKVSLTSSWVFAIIPIGIFFFVVFPQLQNMYESFHKREIEVQQSARKLDSLQQLTKPTREDLNNIKRLEITVPIHQLSIDKQRYTYYKTGGMLAVLAFMFIGMFGSSYWAKRKKNSSNNKQIEFSFEDFTTDTIGQYISWDPVKGSGSNFLSERLRKTSSGYKITSSTYMKFMAWSFFLMGLNYVAWSYIEFFEFSKEPLTFMQGGKMFFISGGPFVLIGVFLLFSFGAKAFLNSQKRKVLVDGEIISFQQVYALQVLSKFIQGNKSGGYHCYEVNLVTQSGERYNLLNHGDKEYLLSDMVKISRFLKVPVWNNGVI